MDKSKSESTVTPSRANSQGKKGRVSGYTNAQILKHNIPLFIMYTLGVILVAFFNIFFAIIFLIYIPISNVIFMAYICAYCPHYGARSSLCGYGLATKYVTKRKNPREFKTKFKQFIAVLFPEWFVPVIVGIYLLYISFDWLVLVLLIIFIVIAFIIIPFDSRSKSCETCKHRDQCPWMSIGRK